jgi:hypothetical protein
MKASAIGPGRAGADACPAFVPDSLIGAGLAKSGAQTRWQGRRCLLEATPGIEPGYTVLQTVA